MHITIYCNDFVSKISCFISIPERHFQDGLFEFCFDRIPLYVDNAPHLRSWQFGLCGLRTQLDYLGWSINSQITGRGIQQRESNNKYYAIYYCPNILSNGHEIYFLFKKKTRSLVRAIVYIYFHAVCLVI